MAGGYPLDYRECFMLIEFIVFPCLVGGIAMWFVAHQIAPVGYSISLSRGCFAVFFMGFLSMLARDFSKPIVGNWCELVEIGVAALVGMSFLQLPFWRSLLAVIVYTIVNICLLYT